MQTFSVFDFIDYFVAQGVSAQNVYFDDETYLLPSKAWIATEFSKSWLDFMAKNGIEKYSDQRNDCDNFSGGARFWFKQLYLKTLAAKNVEADIAFGIFNYTTDSGGGHSINCFFYYEDGLKLGFFEPQTGELVELSEAEKKNILLLHL